MILKLDGLPNPRQREFFLAKARHVAYGGARGGGKSWAVRRKFILLALRYPKLKLLLLRRTLAELRENHLLPLLGELHGVARYTESERAFTFPNSSRIRLGYCDAERDVYQYQGQEYDVIALEEATHFTESQAQFLATCNRTTRTDFTPRMYYTCNPGNVGHAWVKRLFIDRDYTRGEREADYVFIPARVYDNKALLRADPGYLASLENLPEDLRRAHLHGDWDVHCGQYFGEFRRAQHVTEPFTLPSWWRRFCSMDWGYNDPCCVLWHAVDGDGNIYTYRELYVRFTLASRLRNV
jgi:phage terminase large subunit